MLRHIGRHGLEALAAEDASFAAVFYAHAYIIAVVYVFLSAVFLYPARDTGPGAILIYGLPKDGFVDFPEGNGAMPHISEGYGQQWAG
jgi:hypothetical protein